MRIDLHLHNTASDALLTPPVLVQAVLRADTDAAQLAFEIYGLMLGFHQNARLPRAADSTRRARAGLQRLIEDARSIPAGKPATAAAGRARSPSVRAARPARGKARTSSP